MIDSTAAEYAVIGCILIDERCFSTIRDILPTGAFFLNECCRQAYKSICELADSHKAIDPVTVGNNTGLSNHFLIECMKIAPTCINAAEYANSVRENHRRRLLREIGIKMQTDSLSHNTDADHILVDARSALDLLVQESKSCNVRSSSDSLQDFLKFRNDVQNGKCQTIKIGFPSLDGVLGGFEQGGLYVIAARTGVGKSAFGIAIADMLAKINSVLYVSLEMSTKELSARRIAAIIDCPYSKLLSSSTTDAEDVSISQSCSVLSKRKLHLADVSSLSVAELGILAQNAKADIVIVDYLGLLSSANPKVSEYAQITEISRDLKQLAKRLNCVVLALCQLNRESTVTGADKIPKLSQLRSSGAIEQDSDGVLLLHRPEYGQTAITRAPTAPQQFFVDIAKNRHGRTGTVELAWYAPVNRFEDRNGKWPVKSWV